MMTSCRLVFVTACASALSLGCATAPPAPPAPPAPATPSRPEAPSSGAQAFAARPPEYAFADPDRRKKLATAFAAIHALADAAAKAQDIPALEMGIVIDGELVDTHGVALGGYERSIGLDADTGFRIGSLTKSFTALAVLALRDEGKLSLDDPLTRFVPEAAGLVYPTRDAKPITIRQLLTHSSGLPRLGSFDYTRADKSPSEKEVLDSLKGFALENPPGTAFVYSNLGFALLGIAIGRASGMPYRDFVSARILKPLGMTSSGYEAADVGKGRFALGYKRGPDGKREIAAPWMLGASEGAGGIHSTTRDMARYLAFELGAYPPRDADEGPIRRSSVRESHLAAIAGGLFVRDRQGAAKGEPTVDATAGAYGYGWGVAKTCDFNLVSHDGAVDGYASSVAFLPDRGVGVVVLANFVEAELDSLAIDALHELQKTGGLVARKAIIRPDASVDAAVRRFLGVYETWDEGAYKAMLTRNRAPIAPQAEHDEIAGYKAVHGRCHGYQPLDFASPFRGRVLLECEKGRLEMSIALDPGDHLISGFDGRSPGMAVPAKLLPATTGVVALINKWDERLYKRHLASRGNRVRDEVAAFFEKVRIGRAGCKAASAERHGDGSSTILVTCDRGPDLDLVLKVDEKTPEVVEGYGITPASRPGVCPVR